MPKLKIGCVHVYTGNGKGKTTAALGLALRASGAGLKVYIQQFLKNKKCGELKALRKISNIKVSRCGRGPFIIGKPKDPDIECAEKGFKDALEKIVSGKYDVVILDEINIAMKLGLINAGNVLSLIKSKPKHVELVLTGRGCPRSIKIAAHLVTEMKEIRHPYRLGISARRGIDN